ncbi:DUF3667 domain-containing protein [Aequorivita echinoideorum]|uniref:DUF3667 domain-containing protein n=1 Tax=Aequorivita echinoideorum TaxID=1549647 RepID=A0ABS5S9W2_9FLAO|nr:DUF3667 domain-containing protein [Aequorivita echinoideorum]MBT0609132.1 DUF3667 domain-containing protein [Aequorivita echinoideorum]
MKKRRGKNFESGRKSLKYRGNKCLNCNQPLDISDVYCPYCSQLNSNKPITFSDFIAEFVNSIVVYDSRLRNTIQTLLFRPGVITRNYIDGQRTKYANPFRFFLSVSIIFFILQGIINTFDTDTKNNLVNLKTALGNENEEDFTEVEKVAPDSTFRKMGMAEEIFERFEAYNKFYKQTGIQSSVKALDSIGHPNTQMNRFIYGENDVVERIKNDPSSFINYMLAKTPFFLFFFTPFYALFFALLYYRTKSGYAAHVIFIFHIFSFLFLGMIICTIPELFMDSSFFTGLLLLLVGPLYFYKALRNFYNQKRFITILKFVFLSIIFSISATFAAFLFFLVTAAIY